MDGTPLRVAERMRVRSGAVRHVAVDGAADDDGLALQVDADDARTLVADGVTLRLAVAGGAVQAATRGRDGTTRVVSLWPAPGARVAPFLVRAAAREQGGAVVALGRGSTLWVGLVDAQLAAEGPLVALPRAAAAVGAPAVAAWGGGGALAWAERTAGAGYVVVVASLTSAADGEAEAPTVRVLGVGMSPALAALPDGDLLLAYAVGGAGAHRVVLQRLARDLAPRGEPIALSPEALNAGQPAIAVAAGGRALVGFLRRGAGPRAQRAGDPVRVRSRAVSQVRA